MLFGSPGTLVENNTIWVETVSCMRAILVMHTLTLNTCFSPTEYPTRRN